jgi:hypothetical protein
MRNLFCLVFFSALFLTPPLYGTALNSAGPIHKTTLTTPTDSIQPAPELEKSAITAAGMSGSATLMILFAFLAPGAALLLIALAMGLGIFGFVKGIKALKLIARSNKKKRGMGFAIFGIVLGGFWAFTLLISALVALAVLARNRY